MSRKIVTILLALILVLNFIPTHSQAQTTYIVGDGVEIPSKQVPADGSNPYCNCDSSVGRGSHTCCWNYGYYVYYKIWGEFPDRQNSSSNFLRNVAAEDRRLTEENLAAFLKKAVPGAILRIDRRSSVTSGDENGHTLIFVQMNANGDGALFLEGNYNGKGNSRLVEWLFSDLVDSYGPDSRKDYRYIKYLCWPDAPEYFETYVDLCDTYPTYTAVTANRDTVAMRYPCDSDVDPESVAVKDVVSGDRYTASALLRNDKDELWFEIQISDGQDAYVPADAMDVTSTTVMDITVSDVKAPTRLSQGSSFSIKGKINAQFSQLTGVSAYIFSGSDLTAEPLTGGAASVNGQNYSLSGSSVDYQVRFGKLSEGEYTYALFATVVCNYPTVNGHIVSQEQTVCIYQTRFLVADSDTAITTVTFDGNGGACTTDKITDYQGTVLSDLPTAGWDGHIFLGWSLEPAGELIDADMAFTQDTVLYAQWQEDNVRVCGHTDKTFHEAVEADCTHSGSFGYYVCDDCDMVFAEDGVTETTVEAQSIPALDHDWQDASCTEDGVCIRCGEISGQALGHAAGEAVVENEVAPDVNQEGGYDVVVYCVHCGEELSRMHRVLSAVKLLGDANGDGTLNNVDAMLVLQYAVGVINGDSINLENSDVNEDGKVNNVDALLILQMVVGIVPGFRKQNGDISA